MIDQRALRRSFVRSIKSTRVLTLCYGAETPIYDLLTITPGGIIRRHVWVYPDRYVFSHIDMSDFHVRLRRSKGWLIGYHFDQCESLWPLGRVKYDFTKVNHFKSAGLDIIIW